MLLLAADVYDLPTGTVSLCLTVDSARTAVGRSTMPIADPTVWNSLPDEFRNSDSFDSFFKTVHEIILFSRYYRVTSALEVIFIMRSAI